MTRAHPNKNRAANASPDLRSRVRSRHFVWDLNSPESSVQPLMAIGFCDYLQERRSLLRPFQISQMPQSLPLATSAGSNAPFR